MRVVLSLVAVAIALSLAGASKAQASTGAQLAPLAMTLADIRPTHAPSVIDQ